LAVAAAVGEAVDSAVVVAEEAVLAGSVEADSVVEELEAAGRLFAQVR
jgi:hypothetical protein